MKQLFTLLIFASPLLGIGQQVDKILKEYMSRPEFIQHQRETYMVHKELITGKIGPTLELYLKDTVGADSSNLRFIKEAFACEEFRQHSTRIDTQKTTGVIPIKFTTMVAFRDIHYLGNDMFRRYRVNVSIQWDEKFQIVRRKLAFVARDIKSREHWTRGAWYDVQKYFEGK